MAPLLTRRPPPAAARRLDARRDRPGRRPSPPASTRRRSPPTRSPPACCCSSPSSSTPWPSPPRRWSPRSSARASAAAAAELVAALRAPVDDRRRRRSRSSWPPLAPAAPPRLHRRRRRGRAGDGGPAVAGRDARARRPIAFAYDGVLIGAGDYRFLGLAALAYLVAVAPIGAVVLAADAGIGGDLGRAGACGWCCGPWSTTSAPPACSARVPVRARSASEASGEAAPRHRWDRLPRSRRGRAGGRSRVEGPRPRVARPRRARSRARSPPRSSARRARRHRPHGLCPRRRDRVAGERRTAARPSPAPRSPPGPAASTSRPTSCSTAAPVGRTARTIRCRPSATTDGRRPRPSHACWPLAPEAVVVRTSLIYGGPRRDRSPHERAAIDPAATFHIDELRCPIQVDDLARALLELRRRRRCRGAARRRPRGPLPAPLRRADRPAAGASA